MSPKRFENSEVQAEYKRWTGMVGMADPYITRTTIGIHEVLEAHFLLIDYFFQTGEGVGGVGPKNIDLLHSALGRQFTEFGGKPKWNDRLDICATLLFGLIKNHPFHDANKRTAFLISILHLQKIGRTPIASDQEYEDFIVDVSDNKLNKYHWYKEVILPSPDREIMVISKFLKRKTRPIDLQSRTITYKELRRILRGRGLDLLSPDGNRINLVRIKDQNSGSTLHPPKRMAHIGFHGWTRQVSQKDIGIVREASKLDARHGYDSQSFFRGLDDPLTLIKKYKKPLESLAYR